MLEILDRMYTLVWREDDLEASLANLPEDFEWVMPGHPDGAVRHGRRSVSEFFRDWLDQWDDADSDWTLEQTKPDTVLAVVTTRGRGRASGVPVEITYADRDKGRKAAGADPPSQ